VNRTRNLLACSIVPQPTMLPGKPKLFVHFLPLYFSCVSIPSCIFDLSNLTVGGLYKSQSFSLCNMMSYFVPLEAKLFLHLYILRHLSTIKIKHHISKPYNNQKIVGLYIMACVLECTVSTFGQNLDNALFWYSVLHFTISGNVRFQNVFCFKSFKP
jgi:hypothetical protein